MSSQNFRVIYNNNLTTGNISSYSLNNPGFNANELVNIPIDNNLSI
jgi:hypothetical protein